MCKLFGGAFDMQLPGYARCVRCCSPGPGHTGCCRFEGVNVTHGTPLRMYLRLSYIYALSQKCQLWPFSSGKRHQETMIAASIRTDCDIVNTVHDLERTDCSGKLNKQCRYRRAVRCQYMSLLDLQQHQTDAGDVLQDLHSILEIPPAETTDEYNM
jgi:hypothetical protein